MKENPLRCSIFFSLLLAIGAADFSPLLGMTSSPSGRVRIISVDELRRELDSVTILDCRPRQQVRLSRIPGSQHVDWKNWARERADAGNLWFSKKTEWGLLCEPTAKWQEQLRKLGISNSKTVVVVGEPHGWGEEARIAWSLLYWGVGEVALLDGGFPAWSSTAGCPLERGNTKIPNEGDFTFRIRPERRALLQDVKEALTSGQRTIIDTRSPEEFEGKRCMGQKRGGHIPGAISFPVDKLYRTDGRYADKEVLARRVFEKKEHRPIAYCVGGVRSALLAMVWEARFGEVIANYDGSIWEWSSHADLPLVTKTGAAPTP